MRINQFAAGVAVAPRGSLDLEGGELGCIPGDVEAATRIQPVVDAGLVAEFGRPQAMELVTPAGERFTRCFAGMAGGRREDSGRRPG